jgi:hypothetical protein
MIPLSGTQKAIGLILLGIVLMNTCAKLVSDSHDPIELVFYRGLVGNLGVGFLFWATVMGWLFWREVAGRHRRGISVQR